MTQQNGLLIFLGKETHSETKSWKSTRIFDEKSYINNGKPWKSSRIFRVKPNVLIFFIFHLFSPFFFVFLNIFHFLHFSFFLFFTFFHLFFSFVLFFVQRIARDTLEMTPSLSHRECVGICATQRTTWTAEDKVRHYIGTQGKNCGCVKW